jgi:hypothetical protein
MTMKAKTIKDIRDDSGDTDLFIPAGTIINVEHEGDQWIGQTDEWSFPIDKDEFDIIKD